MRGMLDRLKKRCVPQLGGKLSLIKSTFFKTKIMDLRCTHMLVDLWVPPLTHLAPQLQRSGNCGSCLMFLMHLITVQCVVCSFIDTLA